MLLCLVLDINCTIIHLVDLLKDSNLVHEVLMERFGEVIQTNRAVLILPFDVYDLDSQLQYRSTLLDHPHWEAFALMVAHFIAKNSLDSLVMHMSLTMRYIDVGGDVALISCPFSLLDGQDHLVTEHEDKCLNPVLVHAVDYSSGYSLQTGLSSKAYYGLLWEHGNNIYYTMETEDFARSKDLWGCVSCADLPRAMDVQPMVAYIHPNIQPSTRSTNLWQYFLDNQMPPLEPIAAPRIVAERPGSWE
eukprot:Skav204161  [mRNA]  locus=scaffold903:334653:336489:+ [translate_table: standard]